MTEKPESKPKVKKTKKKRVESEASKIRKAKEEAKRRAKSERMKVFLEKQHLKKKGVALTFMALAAKNAILRDLECLSCGAGLKATRDGASACFECDRIHSDSELGLNKCIA
ncbi:hypothetical protein JHD46_05325 [Sulfurimonas sp. SAG-AH-194-C20]|nr:hypothetical protein [Sulfurimonas sp. SAG-AH-194-C20]